MLSYSTVAWHGGCALHHLPQLMTVLCKKLHSEVACNDYRVYLVIRYQNEKPNAAGSELSQHVAAAETWGNSPARSLGFLFRRCV